MFTEFEFFVLFIILFFALAAIINHLGERYFSNQIEKLMNWLDISDDWED